jgi:predicted ATPase
MHCLCEATHVRQRVVLTGGPGAGKTAALELIRQSFCSHVVVLPEAAGIVFSGGFPRDDASPTRKADQRVIFFVQRELEALAEGRNPALVVCDRGTVDGLAYWPGPDDFWPSVGTTHALELGRYDAVIHMRTPTRRHGYNHANPLRIETAAEAHAIDDRIAEAWRAHPRYFEVASAEQFLDKVTAVLAIVRGLVPECCRTASQPPQGSTPGSGQRGAATGCSGRKEKTADRDRGTPDRRSISAGAFRLS